VSRFTDFFAVHCARRPVVEKQWFDRVVGLSDLTALRLTFVSKRIVCFVPRLRTALAI
jgi:hypothetical protein